MFTRHRLSSSRAVVGGVMESQKQIKEFGVQESNSYTKCQRIQDLGVFSPTGTLVYKEEKRKPCSLDSFTEDTQIAKYQPQEVTPVLSPCRLCGRVAFQGKRAISGQGTALHAGHHREHQDAMGRCRSGLANSPEGGLGERLRRMGLSA